MSGMVAAYMKSELFEEQKRVVSKVLNLVSYYWYYYCFLQIITTDTIHRLKSMILSIALSLKEIYLFSYLIHNSIVAVFLLMG